MANNPIGMGFTGYEPELQDITRQREMAKMLLQQGMNTNDLGGQVVSGRYVGASPWQGIAKMYQSYKGRELTNEADRKQAELIEALRRAGVEESKQIMSLARGQEAIPEVVPAGQTLRDDQGQLTMGATAGRAAVAPDIEAAYTAAIGGRSPQAQALAGILGKQLMREPKWEMKGIYNEKTGNTDLYQYDANATDPSKTMKKVGTEKPALSAKDIAELRDKGIALPYGGGQGAGGGGGVSMGGGNISAVAAPYIGMPSAAPAGNQVAPRVAAPQAPQAVTSAASSYVYNPRLSPAQNRELQGKFEAEQQKNIKNAKDSFDIIKQAADVFNSGTPSSGGLQNIGTGIAEFFNMPTKAADADAQLTILGEKLTAQVPRFEGPQSDKDTASYRAAAGDLGNPNKTITTRMSALKQLIELNKKYYPQGDWDKLDISGPVRTSQTFLKGSETMSPEKFKQGLKPQDQEAFDWARRNPNDPRAAAIKKQLGYQ